MSELLTAVSIMFIITGPLLLAANRYDLPTVPFFILAGVIAGFAMDGFGLDEELTLEIAQYGIALLVFSFGVGIDFAAVRSVLGDSEIAALGQIFIVGSLGIGISIVLGVAPTEAIYLGIAAALSSTIVGRALLQTEIDLRLIRGRLASTIQFVQDLLAIVFVLILGTGTLELGPVAAAIGYGLALIALAFLVNRYLFDIIGRLADGSDELMILGVVSLLAAFIGAAEFAGVSIVVGAFAAGLAVRHDPIEYLGLFNGLESIRDFFVAIFFVTIGALITFPFLETGHAESVEKVLIAGGLVVLTVVVKPALTTAILLAKGYERRTATLTGLSIDQVSEFALIIAIQALLIGAISETVFDAIILAAAVTMITSSLSQRYDEQLYRGLVNRGLLPRAHGKIDAWSDVPTDLSDHVVIVGYGRQGKRLVETCEELDHPYVVIENDPARRETVRKECNALVVGDAMEQYTWEKATVEQARLVFSTIESDSVSRQILSADFNADCIVRASEQETALELLEAGALYVGVPELLAGQQLVEHVEDLLEGDLTAEQLRAARQQDLELQADATQPHLQ
ncbi:cation:proton antiporter domain-containing protein [Natronolimnobius baerhuensis]|uniref:Potassium transporter Kef n=1 Tax=Natronolimnobius baerhuensis TaxID=253108 RepID=A0A202EAJ0_9EURY|nr:cation:proton antiporter [Natronolimnobius baerhuensis]OVE85188.1 potassium transporter Kef [Natronolimnobius baerhuensis]